MSDQVFFDDLITTANQFVYMYIHSHTRNRFQMLSAKIESDFKLHLQFHNILEL